MTTTNQAQTLAAIQHETETNCFMLTQDVSTTSTDGKSRTKVGEFSVIVPSVERFIAECTTAKVTGVDADGLPTFDSDAANWLQRAINSLAKSEARNKLQPRTATPKAGQELPVTFAKLVEPAQLGGNTALAELAELARNFSAWLEASGKPAPLAAMMSQLVRQINLIPLQQDKAKTLLVEWLGTYASEAAAAGSLTSYQENHVLKVVEAVQGNDANDIDSLLADY